MSLVSGQGIPGRQDFPRLVEIFGLLVIVEMLGIGQMGLRGRRGHRLVQVETLRMLVRQMLVTRWVLVRETGQVMGVQRMGQEPRPRARRHEGRPASRLPEPIRARAGE
jgi:hypothetical protein